MASGLSFSSGTRLVKLNLAQRSQRAIILMLMTTTLLSGCILRLAYLQLVQGQHQRQLAEQNRVRLLPMPSDRGNILDRKGRLLAANRLARSVYLMPRSQSIAQWQATAPELGKILDLSAQEILDKLDQAGYNSAMPIRISRDLSRTAFVALAERAAQWPGVEIQAESNRYYPHKDLAAHVLGYIGEATADDLKAHPEYPLGMLVGQMGVERMLNTQLEGAWGNRLIEVDAKGKEIRLLGTKPSKAGTSVQLTLDVELQKVAERALGNRRGAVVVLNAQNGAVLALASGPTFDPNLFTRKVTSAEWQRLQAEDKPFLNRALQGYPPGSTFKIVTAAAGMQSGKFSPDSILGTSAYISVGGIQFHEYSGSGYGAIGFPDAFAYSSNTFFYQMGLAAGPEEISKWGRKLGIGEPVNLGLEGAGTGSIPTPAEKQQLYDEPWYAGDTVSMAIGQGLVQVTPLELAVMVSAIANGGWRVKPHLLASQSSTSTFQREATGIAPENLAIIRKGLIEVVKRGTGRQLNDGSIPLTGGKTGTVEIPGQPDNAMYVGFGPADKPEIAVAVVVESGGFGAVSAVPIAHEIYKTYFQKR